MTKIWPSNRNVLRHYLPACLLALVILVPPNIFSCGPFFTEAVFVPKARPVPLKDYLAGDLGVVQPTYYRAYLAVAYRILSGHAFDLTQLAKVQLYWKYNDTVIKDLDAAQTAWGVARDKALGEKPSPPPEKDDPYGRTGYGFISFLNCTPDAYRNAALTLNERTQHFGVASATIKDWVDAQGSVFSNCDNGHSTPTAAPADAPAIIKQDRAYQIAAALFYGGQYQQAVAAFDKIAADKSSPWSTLAPYLAARALVREGTVPVNDPQVPFNAQLLTEAETRLKAILANKQLASIHPAAERTLAFVEFRLHPEARAHVLALSIAGEGHDGNLGQDLIDYTQLLNRLIGTRSSDSDTPAGSKPAEMKMKEIPQQDRALMEADDLTDWVLTAQLQNPIAHQHAMDLWRQKHSLPWLVAAMVTSSAADAGVDDLLKAANGVPANSPGYDSVTYQRARLLVESGKAQQARDLLMPQLKRFPADAPNATRNLYAGLLFRASNSFDDFLKYSTQRPVYLDTGDGESCTGSDCADYVTKDNPDPLAPLFDDYSAATLNQRVPTALLSKAALGGQLPPKLRDALTSATWSRAVLLGDAASAKQLSSALSQKLPSAAKYVSIYDAATDPAARDFAGAFALLHFPGMNPYVNGGMLRQTPIAQIDSFRQNWWAQDMSTDSGGIVFGAICSPWSDYRDQTPAYVPPAQNPASPAFLTADERTLADTQWKQLKQVGPAPNYFGRVVLDWAKDHPDDQRVPEALSLVVRATRYGCNDKQSGGFSRRAFDLLHQKYPKSEWAAKTPHWYQ
jgi:tetratricopeptide (TPR) repeat protein